MWASLAFVFASCTPSWAENPAAEEVSSKAAKHWAESGWPLLQRFCLDCHNEDNSEAELDLTAFRTLEGMDGGNNSMQRVLEMVRFGAMPPEDSDLPTDQERKQLVSALDRTLFAVACDLRPRPGKVTARRLNRAEYNNSVRDLFGMDLEPASGFPSDEVGAGFDNNSDVLSLSTMLIEKYLSAAEEIAAKVVVDPDKLPYLDDERASDQLMLHGATQTGRFNGRFLDKEAFVWADFEIQVPGEYRIRISGGTSEKKNKKQTVAIYNRSGLLLGKDELPYYGGSGSSKNFEFKLQLKPGKHRFYVEPLEEERELEVGKSHSEFFAKLDSRIVAVAAKRQQQPLKPSNGVDESKHPFMIRQIHVRGPSKQPDEAFPPSQWKILRRTAKRKDGRWYEVESAAKECLRPLMERAFREPVTDEEIKPYLELVEQATKRGESYYRGIQIAVSAVLVSPRFLFRVETPPDDMKPEEDGSVRLTQHQLASRLSYFLWSSTPDDRLLSEAKSGRLKDKQLEQQVRRMIADPKGDAMADQFAAQWLGLRNLSEHEADAKKFKAFTPTLRDAMLRETEMLFLHMMRHDRPVVEMLTSDFTFVNQELGKHYGLTGIKSDEFQKVSLHDTPRRGILSHASVLTLTSSPVRTSPVKRGKWVLENVLGTPPPDPPPGVPELEETEVASADASFREQLELHRADPSCAACHRVMDQLGFGMEQFDAIGRYREREGKLKIDASGELPGGRKFNGASELSETLGKSEQTAFAKTFVERLLTFALGRGLSPADRCTVDEIIAKTSKRNHRMIDLIMEVIRSRPFQYYDWPSKE
ncbi:MAG: DUF1592 domain-containing protein [Rubripirellula sp.]